MLTHTHVLENGIKVVIVQSNDSLTTTAGVFIRQGARNEEFEYNGISHFVEHLVSNSCRATQNKKKYVEKIIANGGILNAATTKDITYYYGTCLNQYASDLIKSLHEIVFKASFSEETIELERKVITDELNNKLKSSQQIYEHFWQTIYKEKTYGQWVLGRKEVIESIEKKDLDEYYNTKYVADNTTIIVISSLNVYEMISWVNEAFSEVKLGDVNPNEVPLATDVGLKIIPTKNDQLVLCLGSQCPSFRESSTTEFELLMAVWGSIPSSRLHNVIRGKYGLVYQIQSFTHIFVQTGNFGVITNVNKSKLQDYLKVLYEELHRLREVPFEKKEIIRAVSVLKTYLSTKLNSPEFLLRLIGLRATFGHHFFLNHMVRELERVTPKRLLDLANQYISPEEMSFIGIGDVSEDEILYMINEINEMEGVV